MNEKGFTLSEVLITLVVIGIVSVITVPLIIQNHKKKETISKLQKFHTTICNAFRLAESQNGNAEDWDWGNNNGKGTPFTKSVYLKIFPIIKPYIVYSSISDKCTDHFVKKTTQCTYLNDGSYFYYPNNTIGNYTDIRSGLYHPCMFLSYDVNGEKGPNKPGRDIFTFTYCQPGYSKQLNGKAITVTSIPDVIYFSKKTRAQLINLCSQAETNDFKATYCLQLVLNDGWEFKNDYPLRL